MFPIATIVRPALGKPVFFNGLLFPLPPELRDRSRLEAYSSLNQPGWSSGEFNYQNYLFSTPTGDIYVFPAIRLREGRPVTRSFPGYSATFTREQIENTAMGILKFRNATVASTQSDLNLLVHDLRALSTNIYNSVMEAERYMYLGNREEA